MGVHTVLHPHKVVTIDGIPTRASYVRTQHGVDQPIGTGAISMPLPLPEHLSGEEPEQTINRKIAIQVGYKESILRPVFGGYIDSDSMSVDATSATATFDLIGYASLLAWPEERDLVYNGPILLEDIVKSLCVRRGVPKWRVDRILSPEGERIVLATNPLVNDGTVTIKRRTSPLTWLTRTLALFGYRIFDTPAGELRVHRVSGAPTLGPMGVFAEGKLAHSLQRSRRRDDMVTYWTVEGAQYTDEDGVTVPVRSFPSSVPFRQVLNPPGYRADDVSDAILDTVQLADTVRRVREIDYGAPSTNWSWTCRGNSNYRNGATVRLASGFMGASARDYWLMQVNQTLDERQGYRASLTAWVGSGEQLPEGDDLVTLPVRSAPVHLGDETIGWYASPAPQGKEFPIQVTTPQTFTSLAISMYLHGTNSYLLDGGNSDSEVSKIVVEQNGEEVGSADLPVINEDYELQLPYGSGLDHWQAVRLPVPGRIEEGPVTIKIVAGEDSRASGGPIDDFELRDIVLELRGAGEAILPTGVS